MDRVSNLPKELLFHILSFLTTKEAASTSVLSKRWRKLWKRVPHLDIDNSVFLHPEEGKQKKAEIRESFMDFVDRVLTLQGDSPIKKVSLKCKTGVDFDRVDAWISNVLARGVEDLDLSIHLDKAHKYCLSSKCFESRNLVKLKIGSGISIGWWVGSIFSPMLKTLVLDSVGYYSLNIETLFPALPVLEELVLINVIWEDLDVNVSSASLKTLTIKADEYGLRYCTLSLDTPGLVYFKYSDNVARDYPVVNMKNLVDARIIFCLSELQLERAREPDGDWIVDTYWSGGSEDARSFSNVWKLFHGMRNVLYLYLSPDTLEVFCLCSEKMPVFNNLKLLAIESAMDRGWQAMPVLLRNCPNLETLVLEGLLHFVTDKCGDACDCASREDKGLSLASCPIKMLEIKGFRGTMREIRMIKHFLNYFPCLKKMKIYAEGNESTEFEFPERFEFVREIIELYNKSSSCNVQLLLS